MEHPPKKKDRRYVRRNKCSVKLCPPSANPSVTIPMLPPGSQSFIYLQLSTVAGADKRLQLSCKGPQLPQSGPHIMIVKCMTRNTAFNSTDARQPRRASSIRCFIFHIEKYAHSAFLESSRTLFICD